MSEQKWEEKFEEWYRKEHELSSNAPLFFTDAYLYQRSGYLQACKVRQEEIEKDINEIITLLVAPEMKWDQAMRILFKLVGREYPF